MIIKTPEEVFIDWVKKYNCSITVSTTKMWGVHYVGIIKMKGEMIGFGDAHKKYERARTSAYKLMFHIMTSMLYPDQKVKVMLVTA